MINDQKCEQIFLLYNISIMLVFYSLAHWNIILTLNMSSIISTPHTFIPVSNPPSCMKNDFSTINTFAWCPAILQ